MSLTVCSTTLCAEALPSYFGQGIGGGSATGEYTDLIAKRLLRFSTRQPAEESSGALAQFSKLERTLRQLQQAQEVDEFGPVRPSKSSVNHAIEALFPLVQRGFSLPDALDVGTDHDGAIRIVWENGPRLLELIVPYQDASPYLYYSLGDQYDLQRDLTTDALQKRFNWFCGVSRPQLGDPSR